MVSFFRFSILICIPAASLVVGARGVAMPAPGARNGKNVPCVYHVYMRVCVCVRTHMYTWIHTHTHVYIHTDVSQPTYGIYSHTYRSIQKETQPTERHSRATCMSLGLGFRVYREVFASDVHVLGGRLDSGLEGALLQVALLLRHDRIHGA